VSEGGFGGAVLDVGCGTGENALRVASLGLPVLGVDVAETAVGMARQKAEQRGIDAEFKVADALELGRLDRTFETVLDCGLFHTLDGEERASYLASLASVTGSGATLRLLCFSDADPDAAGPHPVSEDELRAAFENGGGWEVEAVEPSRIHMRLTPGSAPAWLAAIRRIPRPAGRGD
jgi:ubiquinone/menaquinone biosynthesis C-methylase UbiE